jgi:hypothetical protein
MITIYATKDTPCHTLQRLMDDAVTAKWREETRREQPPITGGVLLSGATHYEIMKQGEHYA